VRERDRGTGKRIFRLGLKRRGGRQGQEQKGAIACVMLLMTSLANFSHYARGTAWARV
jgi:hypothetical protein